MSGQPQVLPWITFDVTNLEIFEPPAAIQPSLIVPVNGAFTLRATFTGSGIIWAWLKNLNVQWKAEFSAEGIGANALELDLGNKLGNLTPALDTYTADFVVGGGIAKEGIYEVAVLVRFPQCPGMTGFFKPLVIEVY
jgi:hypothetical protein